MSAVHRHVVFCNAGIIFFSHLNSISLNIPALQLFSFSIVNFPYLCSNIPSSPAYRVYVSQLIRYARACSAYDKFLNRGRLLTNKLLLQGFQQSRLKAAFRKFYGRYNNLVYQYKKAKLTLCQTFETFWNMTCHWVKCCLMCFIAIVRPLFTHWFDYGLFRLPDQD